MAGSYGLCVYSSIYTIILTYYQKQCKISVEFQNLNHNSNHRFIYTNTSYSYYKLRPVISFLYDPCRCVGSLTTYTLCSIKYTGILSFNIYEIVWEAFRYIILCS